MVDSAAIIYDREPLLYWPGLTCRFGAFVAFCIPIYECSIYIS